MKYYQIGFYGDGFENTICTVRGYENARREAKKVESEYGAQPTVRVLAEPIPACEPMGGYWEF